MLMGAAGPVSPGVIMPLLCNAGYLLDSPLPRPSPCFWLWPLAPCWAQGEPQEGSDEWMDAEMMDRGKAKVTEKNPQ